MFITFGSWSASIQIKSFPHARVYITDDSAAAAFTAAVGAVYADVAVNAAVCAASLVFILAMDASTVASAATAATLLLLLLLLVVLLMLL